MAGLLALSWAICDLMGGHQLDTIEEYRESLHLWVL